MSANVIEAFPSLLLNIKINQCSNAVTYHNAYLIDLCDDNELNRDNEFNDTNRNGVILLVFAIFKRSIRSLIMIDNNKYKYFNSVYL